MLTLKPSYRDTPPTPIKEKLPKGRWELRCSLTDQGKANFDTLKDAWEKHLGKRLTQSRFLDYFFAESAKAITKGSN